MHLEEKLNETQFNLHNLSEEHQETLEKLQQQRDEMVQERAVHAQVKNFMQNVKEKVLLFNPLLQPSHASKICLCLYFLCTLISC